MFQYNHTVFVPACLFLIPGLMYTYGNVRPDLRAKEKKVTIACLNHFFVLYSMYIQQLCVTRDIVTT